MAINSASLTTEKCAKRRCTNSKWQQQQQKKTEKGNEMGKEREREKQMTHKNNRIPCSVMSLFLCSTQSRFAFIGKNYIFQSFHIIRNNLEPKGKEYLSVIQALTKMRERTRSGWESHVKHRKKIEEICIYIIQEHRQIHRRLSVSPINLEDTIV